MKIAVAGSEFLSQYVNEIKLDNLFSDVEIIYRTVNPLMYNHFEIGKDLERQNIEMIIAGPVDSELLSNYTQIPYFTLTPSVIDFLSMHSQIDDYSKVCIVNSKHEIINLDVIENFTGIKYNSASYKVTTEVDELLMNLKQQGINTVISNHIVTIKAKELGMKGIYYYSKSSLIDTIKIALKQLENIKRENEYITDVKSILDNIYNGVITTDKDGLVNYANSTAANILKLSSDKLVGQNISKYFPNNIFNYDVFDDTKIQLVINNNQIIGNLIPRRKSNELLGWYFIFENINKILELDTVIRQGIKQTNFKAKYTFDEIIGKSESIHQTIIRAKSFSKKDATVLISGETGTGKEIFAQSIHNASNRSSFPFVAINCSAIPDSLIESELFGYESGSFTGAKAKGKPGLIELAHRGTIFLDDIDGISQSFQAKILRVIQEREIIKIGASNSTPIDVRFIVATNCDFKSLIEEKLFRRDLFYRLNVLTLLLPPLRERKCDIEILLRYYLQLFDNYLYKKIEPNFETIFNTALNYSYPGNIRELINVVERFSSMISYDEQLEVNDYRNLLDECISILPYKDIDNYRSNNSITWDFQKDIREAEKKVLEYYIENFDGSLTDLSKHLGIGRTTLYHKLREFNLKT